MATSTVRVLITGDSAGYIKATQDAAVASNAAADEIGGRINKLTDETAGKLTTMGNTLSNWGVPFAGSISKVGEKFDEADTKGQKFGQAMSTLGGAALLGVGAAAAAVGVEAIEMADKFDTAQASLKTAIDDSGNSFAALKPQIDATYASMANLGYNSTDTAQALAQLTVATQNPTESMKLMATAADIAREKHVDLGTATSALTKLLAGSSRALTQMGINLDIGSGKLSAIATATQSVQKDQLALKTVQDEVAAGSLKGVAASDALTSAHLTLSDAEQKLALDQGTISASLDALHDRVGGAAVAFGNTLPGQMDITRAKLHNLATTLGEELTPLVQRAVTDLTNMAEWLSKNKAPAEILGGVIVTVLGAAMTVFAVDKTTQFLGAVGRIGESILGLGATTTVAATEVEGGMEAIGTATVESAAVVDTAIGSTGIGAIIIGLSIGVMLLATHWKLVWGWIKDAAQDASNFVRAHLTEILLALGPLGLAIFAIKETWRTAWDGAKEVVQDVWAIIKPIFDAMKDSIGVIGKGLGDISHAAGALKGAASGGINKVEGGIAGVLSHFAGGGSISAYQPGIIGENGPELFIPDVSGVVVPNGTTTFSGTSGGNGAPSGDLYLTLQVNGTDFARATWPQFRTILLQNKRAVGTLGLS